jgi:hypothetical protein
MGGPASSYAGTALGMLRAQVLKVMNEEIRENGSKPNNSENNLKWYIKILWTCISHGRKQFRRILTLSTEGRKIKGRPEMKWGKGGEKSEEVKDSSA